MRALWKRFHPGKNYNFFLCHHKAGAAVLCRWLKSEMLQQSGGKVRVFLDSDELEGLADIGDIVKSQTSVLVIAATKLVLTRPWCAVEVATAVRNKIDIVMVKCSDFSFYDEEGFRELRQGWTSADILIFAQNALDPAIVEECYRQLPPVHTLDFDAFADPSKQQSVVTQILQTSYKASAAYREKSRSLILDLTPDVLVLGSLGSSEGRMTCQVLRDMVMERTRKHAWLVSSVKDALQAARTAQYLLVVLTAGLLRDENFLAVLKALDTAFGDERLEIVSALADQNFEFASASYYQELTDRGEDLLVQSVRRVVNILALPFSPQTSIKVMNAQADEICRRFRFKETELRRQVTVSVPVFQQEQSTEDEAGTPPGDVKAEDGSEEEVAVIDSLRDSGIWITTADMEPMRQYSIDTLIVDEPM